MHDYTRADSLLVILTIALISFDYVNRALGEESPSTEDNLERWVQQEASRQGMSCKSLEGGRLDEVSVSFADALLIDKDNDNRDQLQLELAHAINLGELAPQARGSAAASEGAIRKSKGVLDVLESERPLIVHSKSLSPRAIEQLREFARESPRQEERQVLRFLFDAADLQSSHLQERTQLITNDDMQQIANSLAPSETTRQGKTLDEFASSALFLSEALALTPSFVLNLPVIGKGIIQLRNLGQASFFIIKTINSFKRFMEHSKSYPSNSDKGLISKLRSFADKDRHVKLYTEKGVTHLIKLAHKLAESFLKLPEPNSALVREIVVRTAYYLLVNFSTSLQMCD